MNGMLIFAFLSCIILYRLFKSFGREQVVNTKQFEDILKKKMINITENDGNESDTIKLQEVFPEYTTKDVVEELEMIFTTVFKAFADSRHEELKCMLSKHLYESFSERINIREEKNLRQELEIKDVSTEIIDFKILDKKADLKVLFRASQMSATVNSDGISFDNPSKLYIGVTHKWVLERNISSDSKWIVIKTNIVE